MFFLLWLIFYNKPVSAQETSRRTNVFLFDRPAQRKFLSKTFYWRARWHSWFSGGKMVAIRAKSPQDAADKVIAVLNRKHSMIGNLWFDSHGYYYKRISSFCIGRTSVDYTTIKDSAVYFPLKKISRFCDGDSKITLGSCYGGATFYFPDVGKLKGRRMNGDSLLMELGAIFNAATIYGSQSWVMEFPGIWHKNFDLAGAPRLRQYRDFVFLPVWQHLGKWEKYNPLTVRVETCNTICLNRKGDVFEKSKDYFSFRKTQRKIKRNIRRLRPGLYSDNLAK